VLLAIVVVVAAPALITLASIRAPRPPLVIPPDPLHNPSPFGYTWSLLLFAIPCVVLGWWLHAVHRGSIERKAFWATMGLMVPLWCLLDVYFGLTFFKFPNLGASIGTFWGYTFDHGWQKVIPLEEIGFYVFGVMAMLLAYVWADESFLSLYRRKRDLAPGEIERVVSFHPQSAIIGVVDRPGRPCGLSRLLSLFAHRLRRPQRPSLRRRACIHQLARARAHGLLDGVRELVLGGGDRGAVSVVGLQS
jgi:hypothetical protein